MGWASFSDHSNRTDVITRSRWPHSGLIHWWTQMAPTPPTTSESVGVTINQEPTWCQISRPRYGREEKQWLHAIPCGWGGNSVKCHHDPTKSPGSGQLSIRGRMVCGLGRGRSGEVRVPRNELIEWPAGHPSPGRYQGLGYDWA